MKDNLPIYIFCSIMPRQLYSWHFWFILIGSLVLMLLVALFLNTFRVRKKGFAHIKHLVEWCVQKHFLDSSVRKDLLHPLLKTVPEYLLQFMRCSYSAYSSCCTSQETQAMLFAHCEHHPTFLNDNGSFYPTNKRKMVET